MIINNTSSIDEWELWGSEAYLNEYFSKGALGADSIEAWKFLSREMQGLRRSVKQVLDFGSGPTIFGSIPCAPYVDEIHVSDYLQDNIDAIQSWKENRKESFDWRHCISEVLKIEKEGAQPTFLEVEERQEVIRQKITRLQLCNAAESPALNIPEKYPLVVSTYCVDSATDSKETWRLYMKNLLDILDETGVLLLTALRNCKKYRVQNTTFPSANINEHDLANVLNDNGFADSQFNIEVCDANECKKEGFSSLLFAKIQR